MNNETRTTGAQKGLTIDDGLTAYKPIKSQTPKKLEMSDPPTEP
jgi:hypothetical protein